MVPFRHPKSLFLGAVLGLAVAGCVPAKDSPAIASPGSVIRDLRQKLDAPAPSAASTANAATAPAANPAGATGAASAPTAEVRLGSGGFVALDRIANSRKKALESGDGDITLNFQATDLGEVLKVILGDILKVNYVIDPKVTGTVTIQTSRPMTPEGLVPVIETILDENGAMLTRDGDLYRVVPRSEASMATYASTRTSRGQLGYQLAVLPLRYIAVEEMQKLLEPILPKGGVLRADKQRNLLIVTGTDSELGRVRDTVSAFDVNWMRGMSVGLFPLRNVDPKTLIGELGDAMQDRDGELFGGMVRLVPIDRLNAVLAVSRRPEALIETQDWVTRLDRSGQKSGRRLFVYRLRNAKAADLAGILNSLYTGKSEGAAATVTAGQVAPGQEPAVLGTPPGADASQGSVAATAAQAVQDLGALSASGAAPPAANVASPAVASSTGPTVLQGDAVRIIADPAHNALIVSATSQEYEVIEDAIQRLDIVPMQVLVEATILEVTLTNDLSYGVQWFFNNAVGDGYQGNGLLDLNVSGLGPILPGFSYAIVDSADQVHVILNALDSRTNVSVLSSPSLVVLDNQTATINVGDEIPVPTRQSTSNVDPNAPTVNEIEYRNTGVILSVLPHINDGGLITMDVSQEVSDAVSTTTSGLNAPTIRQRKVTSSVAVNSGETVILGGLIRNNATDGRNGIPGLHRLPLIGNLFGETSKTQQRTELLVLLTPKAVKSSSDARDVTKEYLGKVHALAPEAHTTP